MGHQELYNPRGRIERIFLRSLLVLAVLGQVCGAPFTFKGQLRNAIVSCLTSVSGGEECCSSGLADCGPAGTTDMPDWDVGLIQDMSDLFNNFPQPPWRIFNQDISSWDVNNVTNMNFMFQYCKSFDADITGWETPKLLASAQMFGRLGTDMFDANVWLAEYERIDGRATKNGPPSAWRRRDQPPLPPSPPHLESPPPPARAVPSPPPPPGSVPEVSPPPPPAYDPPTTSVGVGTVVLVAFIMLVVGFVSGYVVRLLRSKKGVPILDEESDEENLETPLLSSDA
jgi:hypothetical protein